MSRFAIFPGHPRGEVKANKVGGFVKLGKTFEIIRPGFDTQGRKRVQWTQITHQGVPIFEHKLQADLDLVLERFDRLWEKTIGEDEALLERALTSTMQERARKFKDGASGMGAAPALTRDGRSPGKRYDR